MKNKISYGKNVYNKKEINAVLKTLNNSTQMGKSVETFEKKNFKIIFKKIWPDGKLRIIGINFSTESNELPQR